MPEELGSEGVNEGGESQPLETEVLESPTEASQEESAQPPTEEHSAQTDPEVSKAVPYNRFKEVNDKAKAAELRAIENERLAKDLQAKLAQFESSQAEKQNQSQRFTRASERLSKLGVEPAAAKEIAEIIDELAGERAQEAVKPLAAHDVQQEINGWTREFARTHDDYEDMAPEMNKVLVSLPEQMQAMVAIDPKGLDLLYAYAKQNNAGADLQRARQEGAEEAYSTKRLKGAVSGSQGAAPSQPKVLTEQDITEMPMKEYMKLREDPKRWAEVMAQLSKGQKD